MNKKIAFGLTALALATVVAGCNKKKEEEKKTLDSLTVCLASEPQSIDPALNSSVDGATLLVHLNSGLYKYYQKEDGALGLKFDLAKNITKETATVVDHVADGDGWKAVTYETGTRYTVELRDDIKWSDGTKITADDFIWSWNRASGSTLGADYGYMFEFLCDGVAHESDDKAFPSLAVNKISDTKFTFDVMVDNKFMDQLLAFPTYQPVQKATVDANDTEVDGHWATEVATYRSCGAYKLAEWEHDTYIKLVKNEDYWDAANIELKEITFALSDDTEAMYTNYTNGTYQMIDDIDTDTLVQLKNAGVEDLTIAGQMGTYYVSFNVNKQFAKAETEEENAKVRKALGLMINRQYIVDEIGAAGQVPANAFVSSGLSDVAGGEFVDHNGVNGDGSGYYDKGETEAAYKANCDEAVALLKEVGYAYDEATGKFTDFDTDVIYLYNTSAGHKAIAENLRDTWAKYGINVTLENQDWATFLTTRKAGQYTIARNGWLADYDDPSSYLSMWTTQSGNNDCQFGKGAHADQAIYSIDLDLDGVIEENEKNLTWAQSYDVMMDASNKENDDAKRYQMLHAIENLLMETGAICPVYYYTDPYLIKPEIKGFFSSPLGYKFFMHCTY